LIAKAINQPNNYLMQQFNYETFIAKNPEIIVSGSICPYVIEPVPPSALSACPAGARISLLSGLKANARYLPVD